MKNIGKPYAVAPHVRFDEEGLVRSTMEWLLRHRQTKGAETDRRFLMVIGSQEGVQNSVSVCKSPNALRLLTTETGDRSTQFVSMR